jgi:hypothetical protein
MLAVMRIIHQQHRLVLTPLMSLPPHPGTPNRSRAGLACLLPPRAVLHPPPCPRLVPSRAQSALPAAPSCPQCQDHHLCMAPPCC